MKDFQVLRIKYKRFGLREEWIFAFMEEGEVFLRNNSLGPKQIEAFIRFLIDLELINKKKVLTDFYFLMKGLYKKEKMNSEIFWGILWVNLCFNSPLFLWWTTLSIKSYDRKEILEKMFFSYGKYNRSIENGFSSIRETFVKSPIGKLLGQAVVVKKGNVTVEFIKKGLKYLNPLVILYNLYKYSERVNLYEMNLSLLEKELLSPQKNFAISTMDLEKSLLENSKFEVFYNISLEKKHYILLNKFLDSITLLKKYLGDVYEV